MKCPDCGENNVQPREIEGVHDLKCHDCGAVFGDDNLVGRPFAVAVRFEGFVERYLVDCANPDEPLDGRECWDGFNQVRSGRPLRTLEFPTRGEAQAAADRFQSANAAQQRHNWQKRRYEVVQRGWMPTWEPVR